MRKIFKSLALNIGVILTPFALFQSCAVLSTYQSAKTIGKRNFEATGNYTNSTLFNNGKGVKLGPASDTYNSFGVQGSYGLSDRFDAGFRFERIILNDDTGVKTGVSFISISGKFNLVENKISAYLPIGMYFKENFDVPTQTIHIRPTILGNIDINDNIEITPMIGYYLPITEDGYKYFQVGVGAGVCFPKAEGLSIRPELGLAFLNGEKNSDPLRILNAGVGVIWKFQKK